MKLSDYLIGQLADWGVRHNFLVTGGGAMHLNDSIGKEARIQFVCNHHEQASAMAAEAYARVSGLPGVVNVTTGPGGINALNGSSGRGPTPFRCWSSPARSSVKPACARWGSRPAPTRRPGSRHRRHGREHYQICSTGRRSTFHPLPPRARWHLVARWTPRSLLARHPGGCPGHVHRSRDASRYDPAEDESALNTIDGEQLTSRLPDSSRSDPKCEATCNPGWHRRPRRSCHLARIRRTLPPSRRARHHCLDARPDRSDDPLFLRTEGTHRRPRRKLHVQSATSS